MKITINEKEFESKKINVKLYMEYTKASKKINERINKNELYTDEDFEDMAEMLVKVYDNQFDKEDLFDMEADEFIFAFNEIDLQVGEKLQKKIELMQKAFTKGKK